MSFYGVRRDGGLFFLTRDGEVVRERCWRTHREAADAALRLNREQGIVSEPCDG